VIYIEILHGIVPPPAAPAWNVVRSWGDVERQLGVALPDDYKELVGSYGAGAFDAFIWLLNPLTTNEYLNLIVQRDVRLRAHAEFAAEFAAPYRGFDGSGGLLPCAFTASQTMGMLFTGTCAAFRGAGRLLCRVVALQLGRIFRCR
jgi:hypothetical protein